MKSLFIALSVVPLLQISVYTASAIDNGPAMITFPAKNGDVSFSHKKHIEANRNCKTCHDRKGGKIKGLGREWAHKVCVGCHEGIMVGPTECKGCHGMNR